MAKFNIVNDTFIGKMGDIIGQRWKDISYIKAYTKPHNPRTKLQQDNRSIFSLANGVALIANQATPNAFIFENQKISKWQARVSTALKRIASGDLILECVPTTPIGFIEGFQIDSITMTGTKDGIYEVFSVSGNLPKEDTEVSVILETVPNEISIQHIKILNAFFEAGTKPTIKIENTTGKEINQFNSVKIISKKMVVDREKIVWSNELEVINKNYTWQTFIQAQIDFQQFASDFLLYLDAPIDYVLSICRAGYIEIEVDKVFKKISLSRISIVTANNKTAIKISNFSNRSKPIVRAKTGSNFFTKEIKIMYETNGLRTQDFSAKVIQHTFTTEVKIYNATLTNIQIDLGNAQSVQMQCSGYLVLNALIGNEYKVINIELSNAKIIDNKLIVNVYPNIQDDFFYPLLAEKSTVKISDGILRINHGTYVTTTEEINVGFETIPSSVMQFFKYENGYYYFKLPKEYAQGNPTFAFRLKGEYAQTENPFFYLAQKTTDSEGNVLFKTMLVTQGVIKEGIDLQKCTPQTNGSQVITNYTGKVFSGGDVQLSITDFSKIQEITTSQTNEVIVYFNGVSDRNAIYCSTSLLIYEYDNVRKSQEYSLSNVLGQTDLTRLQFTASDGTFNISELKKAHPAIKASFHIYNLSYASTIGIGKTQAMEITNVKIS